MKSCCDEYCANFGCNQGRWCPAGAAKVAKVAKVGQRHLAAEPLPPAAWRGRLERMARTMLTLIVGLLCFAYLVVGAQMVGMP